MVRLYWLIIRANEIRGKCPVFEVADKIIIESPHIILNETDALCIHALGSTLSVIVALSYDISFEDLGLALKKATLAMLNVSTLELYIRQVEL